MTGEHLSPDILELLRLFARHRVRFLLVGGEAVIHHGYPRLTGDVDLFYERTPSNVERLYDALLAFWGGDVPVIAAPEELLEPDVVVQFGRPPNRIDLISSLGGVTFASAWRRRIVERISFHPRPIPLPILSLPDLVRAKLDAGRPKDLDDVEHLRAIRARKRRKGRKRR